MTDRREFLKLLGAAGGAAAAGAKAEPERITVKSPKDDRFDLRCRNCGGKCPVDPPALSCCPECDHRPYPVVLDLDTAERVIVSAQPMYRYWRPPAFPPLVNPSDRHVRFMPDGTIEHRHKMQYTYTAEFMRPPPLVQRMRIGSELQLISDRYRINQVARCMRVTCTGFHNSPDARTTEIEAVYYE